MADVVYNIAKARMASGSLDWDTTDIRCLLIGTNANTPAQMYNPDLDTVQALLALAGIAELATTGYSRRTVGTRTVTEDDANDRANLDAGSITWTAIGTGAEAARALVIFEEGGGTDATRNLISFHDTNFPKTLNGGDLTVNTPNDVIRVL